VYVTRASYIGPFCSLEGVPSFERDDRQGSKKFAKPPPVCLQQQLRITLQEHSRFSSATALAGLVGVVGPRGPLDLERVALSLLNGAHRILGELQEPACVVQLVLAYGLLRTPD
jgi:hypothetical protein